MADLAGLPRQKLFDVMGAGPLRSGMMEFVAANALEGDPMKLAFSVSNARKDVGYYNSMADDFGAPTQMGQAAKNALGLAKAQGWGDRMVPEMVDFMAALFSDKPKA